MKFGLLTGSLSLIISPRSRELHELYILIKPATMVCIGLIMLGSLILPLENIEIPI